MRKLLFVLLLSCPLLLACPTERKAFEIIGPLQGVTAPSGQTGVVFTEAWRVGVGMRHLADVVASHGIDTDGYRIDAVADISADGQTIVGRAKSPSGNFYGYILRLDGIH